MRNYKFNILVSLASIALFSSCSTLEKTTAHGFTSGYYKLNYENKATNVYVDVADDQIDVYHQSNNQPDKEKLLSISLKNSDSAGLVTFKFRKKSTDIDITSILLKYRPSVYGLPQQLTADLNIALYAGRRYDNYKIINKVDPLGRHHYKITNLGYDFGFFAGPGISPVTPFTTNNRTDNEYSGMIIQMGIAGFIESNLASFGVAAGLDHLLNRDRKIWIYNKKPWVGFIVGIAIN